MKAAEVVQRERLRDPSRRPLLVVVTDGRATAGSDPVGRAHQAAAHLGRPSARTAQQHLRSERQAQRLRYAVAARVRGAHDELAQRRAPRLRLALTTRLERAHDDLTRERDALRAGLALRLQQAARQCDHIELRLKLLDPRLVLQRGYALLTDSDSGHPITSPQQAQPGQAVRAMLADGELDLRVLPDRAAAD